MTPLGEVPVGLLLLNPNFFKGSPHPEHGHHNEEPNALCSSGDWVVGPDHMDILCGLICTQTHEVVESLFTTRWPQWRRKLREIKRDILLSHHVACRLECTGRGIAKSKIQTLKPWEELRECSDTTPNCHAQEPYNDPSPTVTTQKTEV